ncbi:MAG: class I SAM-dependent methyltransferase [Bacteroidota bacterium]
MTKISTLIKNILPRQLKSSLDRWRLKQTKPIEFTYLSLLEKQTLDTLRDAELLEQLLLSLGLNDENLQEFPEELYTYCGYGLRHWQYPKQFVPYLIHLSQYPIQSYLEIGVRHGGTFLITLNYLKKFNSFQKAFAVDIVKNDALLNQSEKIGDFRFLQMDSNGKTFQEFMEQVQEIDLVLIDGNHEESYCRNDFETVKPYANLIAFHDIVSNACPGVVKVWKEVKSEYSNEYEFFEFIDQYESVIKRTGKSFLGIGLAVRKDFIREKLNV